MKINELFLTPDQLKYKQTKSPINRKWQTLVKSSPERPQLGGGKFASVYAPEKLPGSVEKVAKPEWLESLADDGYYQYLDMISKNERIANNPFFPKIHNLQTFRGSDGKYTYKVELEKLHPLSSLSTEEIITIGRKLFTNFDQLFKNRKKMFDVGTNPSSDTSEYHDDTNKRQHQYESKLRYAAMNTLSMLFDKAIDWSSEVSTNIKDPNLKKALMMIRSIVKSTPNSTPDIHEDNIMVRRGPFAPQIVITDPIA